MNLFKYEHVSILKPDLKDYDKEIEELKKQAGDNIAKVQNIGMKKLAYTLQGCKHGYYVLIEFTATASRVVQLEKYCRLNENIIKFITVKNND